MTNVTAINVVPVLTDVCVVKVLTRSRHSKVQMELKWQFIAVDRFLAFISGKCARTLPEMTAHCSSSPTRSLDLSRNTPRSPTCVQKYFGFNMQTQWKWMPMCTCNRPWSWGWRVLSQSCIFLARATLLPTTGFKISDSLCEQGNYYRVRFYFSECEFWFSVFFQLLVLFFRIYR